MLNQVHDLSILKAMDKRLESIDTKTNKTTDFRNITFLCKYNSKFEDGVDTSIYTYEVNPPILLESIDYELALLDIETYYTFPNIDSSNCNIRYFSAKNNVWNTVVIPTGTYTLKGIDTEFQTQQIANGDAPVPFTVSEINETLKSKLTIAGTVSGRAYAIDFSYPNSINKILGFSAGTYVNGSGTKRTYISPNNVSIMDISSIYVNCDLITGSYVNGVPTPAIYSFFPNVPPGYKIVEKPYHTVFLPINRSMINSFKVWLSDQDENKLNFRGENVSIRFVLRKIPFK